MGVELPMGEALDDGVATGATVWITVVEVVVLGVLSEALVVVTTGSAFVVRLTGVAFVVVLMIVVFVVVAGAFLVVVVVALPALGISGPL